MNALLIIWHGGKEVLEVCRARGTGRAIKVFVVELALVWAIAGWELDGYNLYNAIFCEQNWVRVARARWHAFVPTRVGRFPARILPDDLDRGRVMPRQFTVLLAHDGLAQCFHGSSGISKLTLSADNVFLFCPTRRNALPSYLIRCLENDDFVEIQLSGGRLNVLEKLSEIALI